MYLVAAILCTLIVIAMAWFVYECVTAPLLDEDGNVVEDKWGRMGPPK